MSATIWLLLLCALGVRRAGTEARHHSEPHLDNAIPGKSSAIDHEHKLLLECQHADYRTYIKCLKREKRQHYDDSENRRTCLDECLERNCTNHACTRDCYTHCKKRIIEVSSKTVETTYDCANGDCHSNVPNITTNIHIQNIPPNITLNCEKPNGSGGSGGGGSGGTGGSGSNGTGGAGGTGGTGSGGSGSGGSGSGGSGKDGANTPKLDINNVINNNFIQPTSVPALCPCPGCYCYQWQPQITIGIGLGGGPIGGGCIYSSWPCLQKNPSSVDCSMCNNPFLRYQCNPTCVSVQSPNATTAISRQGQLNSSDRQYNGNGYRSNV